MLTTPKRTITVRWKDAGGKAHSERRMVSFEKGFGPYVKWNRRAIPIDSTQTELVLDELGPSQRNQRLE